ncbi:MAG: argininosuccinate lyase [Gemmatimonadales bacterium]|jgi:argininosuccinate lyase
MSGADGFALWGGRFEAGGLAPEADALNRSLPIDVRLWREEVEVAAAWVEALGELGVWPVGETRQLSDGLKRVEARLSDGAAEAAPDEDIHTLVERLLAEEIGDVAGALRTGRSRNDQAATATRLWVIRAVRRLRADMRRLQAALVAQAEQTIDVLAPAYTHLQRAQPIRFAQFFLSHFWALERDQARWAAAGDRASAMPLGAGAVAGSGFAVDRDSLRRRLGFERVTPNSVDAVSDRDFVAEFAFAGGLTGVHLSRLAEDLILFASSEFGFVRFADAYSTGSSLMPQKRNPDIAELARGQSARLLGAVTAALALSKGLPSGYNKDLQEDKAILFQVHDTLNRLLPALAGAVETLSVDGEATARALDPGLLAVDIADALVGEGIKFDEAHEVVGALVREAERSGLTLFEISPEQAGGVHASLPLALEKVTRGGIVEACRRAVDSRTVSGGSGREALREQFAAARSALAEA